MTQQIVQNILSKKLYIAVVSLLVLFGLTIFILPASSASAQNSIPAEAKTSFSKLCTELNKINSSSGNSDKLHKKYCDSKTPTTLANMTKAANDICKDYGSNRLEDECKDYRDKNGDNSGPLTVSNIEGKATHQCGKGENAVKTKFNFGCAGNKYSGSTLNPILDVAYTIIRFLSIGVGIAVVGSIIWAGILYSSSQGNPEQTQAAKNRIRDSIIGLVLYLFIFAIVQYLVPGGLFT